MKEANEVMREEEGQEAERKKQRWLMMKEVVRVFLEKMNMGVESVRFPLGNEAWEVEMLSCIEMFLEKEKKVSRSFFTLWKVAHKNRVKVVLFQSKFKKPVKFDRSAYEKYVSELWQAAVNEVCEKHHKSKQVKEIKAVSVGVAMAVFGKR